MLSELPAAERHRQVAHDFTEHARRVTDWDAPTPVAGWTVRDVVDHLVTWLPGLLSAGGVELPAVVPTDDEPVAVWAAHTARVQTLLDDPTQGTAPFSHPQVGATSATDAVDRLYTPDVFLHTWDLARAAGQSVTLDPAFCAALLDGMSVMEDVLRASGQYGPPVAVPPEADPQTRLIGFIGRDPTWLPSSR